MRYVRLLLWGAVFLALLVGGWRFAHLNAAPVDVHYLAGHFAEIPLWAALLGAFVIGAAVAGTLASYEAAKLTVRARRYRKAALGFEAEVQQLRSLPLVDEDAPAPGAVDEPAAEPRDAATDPTVAAAPAPGG